MMRVRVAALAAMLLWTLPAPAQTTAAAGQERSTLRRIESDPERVAACPRNAARKLDQLRKMPAIGSHEEECHRAMSVNV